MGKRFVEAVVTPAHADEERSVLKRVMVTGPAIYEIERRRKDGTLGYISA